MRLAALADIHGNADALAAVLADVKAFAPDAIVNLGDCFSGPLDAGRTAELLDGAGIAVTVCGNHDRQLLDVGDMGDWEAAALPHLSAATLSWVRSLPATAVLGDVFLCHATPQDDLTYWLETTAPDATRRMAGLAHILARAEGISQSLMLCGHTHIARAVRLPDGRMVVNPGSVGCPGFHDPTPPMPHSVFTGCPFASYAVLDQVGGGWAVTQRMVPYDTAPAVARARATGWDDWAAVLSSGWL